MTEKRDGGPADWRKRLEAILAKKEKLAKAHAEIKAQRTLNRACPWCGLPLGRYSIAWQRGTPQNICKPKKERP